VVTSQQIEEMAKVIWPQARSIAVTRNHDGRGPRGGSESEGFKLAVSNESGLVALISAASLDGIKTKLERRSQKKQWGSFD
jgi:hypothetical protein